MECPKCGFDQAEGGSECPRCGIVFAKWYEAKKFPPVHRVPPASTGAANSEAKTGSEGDVFGPEELRLLGLALGAAILLYLFGWTRLIASALITLFHEFGHAVIGWLFGHPSLPAFDFVYGGGFTHYGELNVWVAIAVAGLFFWGGWVYRRRPATLGVIVAVFLVWFLIVVSSWRRELVLAAAGHVSELVLSCLFLYRALTGGGWRIPEVERPLAAVMALFAQIHSLGFAYRLRTDPGFLAEYLAGKGGALMNDLESISLDLMIHLGLRLDVQELAGWLLAASLLPLPLAAVLYGTRRRWLPAVRQLVASENL